MGKLSVKQKAEAYDKALEVLHKYDGANIMFSQSLKEEMFPELKEETNDERARKWIIKQIKTYDPSDTREKALAWLEKQDEPKYTKKDVDDAYLKGVCDTKQELEKQYNINPSEDELEALRMFTYEPTKNWSEEDRIRITNCIQLIGKTGDGEVKWLKSLENRVLPPKQEWSEDIQQWIDTIIKDYEGWYDADKDHRATIQAKISILKSLRPQSQWKPSKEQMDALKQCIDYRVNLRTLYDDLEKL